VKKSLHARPEAVLEFSVAVIELYFRIEAITQAVGGFTNVGGEYGVMKTLVTEGPHTVPDIARSRPVSRQHCQTIVNGLYDKGFVAFVENPRHKRSPLVEITKKGRAYFDRLSNTFLGAAAAYAPRFTQAEVESATQTLRKAKNVLVLA
jgi:DNA-binding MarR family transcriptional regulator